MDKFVKRSPAVFLLIAYLSLISIGGCKKTPKLNDEQKTKLATAAAAAKERAVSFSLIGPQLVAKDSADAAGVAAFVTNHQRSLNAQAAGLSSLNDAIKSGSNLRTQSREGLRSQVTDAQANVAAFKAIMPKLNLSDAQNAWAIQHAAALQVLADDFSSVATSFQTSTSTSTSTLTGKSP